MHLLFSYIPHPPTHPSLRPLPLAEQGVGNISELGLARSSSKLKISMETPEQTPQDNPAQDSVVCFFLVIMSEYDRMLKAEMECQKHVDILETLDFSLLLAHGAPPSKRPRPILPFLKCCGILAKINVILICDEYYPAGT